MRSKTQTATSNHALRKTPGDDASTVIVGSFHRDTTPLSRSNGVPVGSTGGAHLHEWLLAATLTAPVSYFQPPWDSFRTSMYPAVIVGMVAGKKRLSLQAARRMALGVLADTETRLWRERAIEAQFVVSFWNDEAS